MTKNKAKYILLIFIAFCVIGCIERKSTTISDKIQSIERQTTENWFAGTIMTTVITTEKGYVWCTQSKNCPMRVGDEIEVVFTPIYYFRIKKDD